MTRIIDTMPTTTYPSYYSTATMLRYVGYMTDDRGLSKSALMQSLPGNLTCYFRFLGGYPYNTNRSHYIYGTLRNATQNVQVWVHHRTGEGSPNQYFGFGSTGGTGGTEVFAGANVQTTTWFKMTLSRSSNTVSAWYSTDNVATPELVTSWTSLGTVTFTSFEPTSFGVVTSNDASDVATCYYLSQQSTSGSGVVFF